MTWSDQGRVCGSQVVSAGQSEYTPGSRASVTSAQIQFLEEVIALVVDDDEGGEVLDLDPPDRFHAEFGIFQHFDLLDAVLRQARGGAADGAEIKAAMACLQASRTWRERLPLASMTMEPPKDWNWST